MSYRRVAIIGLGLMGGSLALALRKKKLAQEVIGWTRSRQNSIKAKRAKVITKMAATPEDAVAGADLVVLATPVKTIPSLLLQISPYTDPNVLLTDMGSTKSWIVREARLALKKKRLFCGGHPLCGSEKKGVGVADPHLYEGATYVLTPTTPHPSISRFKSTLRKIGARPIELTPAVHDRYLALTSHLPHLIAFALSRSTAQKDNGILPKVVSTGFRDMTRLAESDPKLWHDIFLTNKRKVSQAVKSFSKEVIAAQKLMESDSTEFLKWLASAQKSRRKLTRKQGRGMGKTLEFTLE